MRIDVLTLFPQVFGEILRHSIPGRAERAGLVSYHVHDIRQWAGNRHGKVDDRPFGGGPGMVMMCQPLYDAVLAVEPLDPAPATRVLLTPQGERLEQRRVEDLARRPRLLLIAGHYEGIDERVIEELEPVQISIGDYVLSGGEIPALVLIDAVVRLVPGALGHELGSSQDSFAPQEPAGSSRLLEGPQYTRPAVWRGRSAPPVLLSGDHAAVFAWRRRMMLDRTRQRRPDLLEETQAPAEQEDLHLRSDRECP
jgi:tRNA (guanine37-N1)-methyltransferase